MKTYFWYFYMTIFKSIPSIYVIANGKWGPWSSYSECSVTCGTGNKTRSRKCNNPPPSGNGKKCEGKKEQTVDCLVDYCPSKRTIKF